MPAGIAGIWPRPTAVKLEQPSNAEYMTLETLGGICIDEMEVQRMNACWLIFRSVSGSSTAESMEQSMKA